MRAGGLMLVVGAGILLITGWWAEAVNWVQVRLVADSGTVV